MASALILAISVCAIAWPIVLSVEQPEAVSSKARPIDSNARSFAQPPTVEELSRISQRTLQRPLVDPAPVSTPVTPASARRPPAYPDADLIAVFGSGENAVAIVQNRSGTRSNVKVDGRLGVWQVNRIEASEIHLQSGEFHHSIPLLDQ